MNEGHRQANRREGRRDDRGDERRDERRGERRREERGDERRGDERRELRREERGDERRGDERREWRREERGDERRDERRDERDDERRYERRCDEQCNEWRGGDPTTVEGVFERVCGPNQDQWLCPLSCEGLAKLKPYSELVEMEIGGNGALPNRACKGCKSNYANKLGLKDHADRNVGSAEMLDEDDSDYEEDAAFACKMHQRLSRWIRSSVSSGDREAQLKRQLAGQNASNQQGRRKMQQEHERALGVFQQKHTSEREQLKQAILQERREREKREEKLLELHDEFVRSATDQECELQLLKQRAFNAEKAACDQQEVRAGRTSNRPPHTLRLPCAALTSGT